MVLPIAREMDARDWMGRRIEHEAARHEQRLAAWLGDTLDATSHPTREQGADMTERYSLDQQRHVTAIRGLLEQALILAEKIDGLGEVCALQKELCEEIEPLLAAASRMAARASYWINKP
jgi:hypothetical protein